MELPDSTSTPVNTAKATSTARPPNGGVSEGLQVLRILLKELSTKKDAVRNVRQFFFKKIVPGGYVNEAVQGILDHAHKLRSKSGEKLFRAKLAVVYVVDAILRKQVQSFKPDMALSIQHAFEPHLETLIRLCVESTDKSIDRSLKLRRVVEAWSSQPFVSDAVRAKCLDVAGLTSSENKTRGADSEASADGSDDNVPFRTSSSSTEAAHELPPHILKPPPPPPSPPPPPRSRPDRSSQHLKANKMKPEVASSSVNGRSAIQGGPVAAVLESQNERREDSLAGHDRKLQTSSGGDSHSGLVEDSRTKIRDEGLRSTAGEDPRIRSSQDPRPGLGESQQPYQGEVPSSIVHDNSSDRRMASIGSKLRDYPRDLLWESNHRGNEGENLQKGESSWDRRGDDARGSRMAEDPRNRRSEDSRGGGKGESSWDRRGDDARFGMNGNGYGGHRADGDGGRFGRDLRRRRDEDLRLSSRRDRSRSRERRFGRGNVSPADRANPTNDRHHNDAQNMRRSVPPRDFTRSTIDGSRGGHRSDDGLKASEQSRAERSGSKRSPRGRDESKTSRGANDDLKTRNDDDEQPSEKRQRVASTSELGGHAQSSSQARDKLSAQEGTALDESNPMEPSEPTLPLKTYQRQRTTADGKSDSGTSCGDENIDFDYSDLEDGDERILAIIGDE